MKKFLSKLVLSVFILSLMLQTVIASSKITGDLKVSKFTDLDVNDPFYLQAKYFTDLGVLKWDEKNRKFNGQEQISLEQAYSIMFKLMYPFYDHSKTKDSNSFKLLFKKTEKQEEAYLSGLKDKNVKDIVSLFEYPKLGYVNVKGDLRDSYKRVNPADVKWYAPISKGMFYRIAFDMLSLKKERIDGSMDISMPVQFVKAPSLLGDHYLALASKHSDGLYDFSSEIYIQRLIGLKEYTAKQMANDTFTKYELLQVLGEFEVYLAGLRNDKVTFENYVKNLDKYAQSLLNKSKNRLSDLAKKVNYKKLDKKGFTVVLVGASALSEANNSRLVRDLDKVTVKKDALFIETKIFNYTYKDGNVAEERNFFASNVVLLYYNDTLIDYFNDNEVFVDSFASSCMDIALMGNAASDYTGSSSDRRILAIVHYLSK